MRTAQFGHNKEDDALEVALKSQFNVAFLNAENLFVLSDKKLETLDPRLFEREWRALSSSIYPNKPLAKVRRLASVIEKLDLDLVLMCEVGGVESLKNFNQWFLEGRYQAALFEGNSDRSIDLGVLYRPQEGLDVQIRSHRHRTIPLVYPHEKQSLGSGYGHLHPDLGRRKFSRDVLQVDLYLEGVLGAEFLFTHLKSKREITHLDPEAQARREAELEALVDIYLERQRKVDVPLYVCGDFNGRASGAQVEDEFKALHERTDLKDVLEVLGVPDGDRWTFINRNWKKVDLVALDYIFTGVRGAGNIEAGGVYRYSSPHGFLSSPTRAQTLRDSWPSDHCPVWMSLKGLW